MAGEDTMSQRAWVLGLSFAAQVPLLAVFMAKSRAHRGRVAATAAIGLAVFAPAALATAFIAHRLLVGLGMETETAIGHETLAEIAAAPREAATWIVIAIVVLGIAVTEEVLYRGMLQPIIDTIIGATGRWPAIVATSAVFAAMHIGAAHASALIGLFVLSLGLGWARERSGSVIAPILIHAGFNALNIALVLSGYSTTP